MIKFFIFIIYTLYILTINLNEIHLFQKLISENSDTEVFNILRSLIVYILGDDDSFLDNLDLSEQCYEQLTNSFFQYHMSISISSFPYYQKLFLDSSRNKNDLTSYSDCIDRPIDNNIGTKELVNFTYLTVLVDDKKSLYDMLTENKGISEFLIGLCIIDKCEIDDYKKLFKRL